MAVRILIIEDHPDQREALKALLENVGYSVSTASDGEEGLRQVRENTPDMVLSDLMVPKLNGYEVCATLKQDARYQKIPFIILSATRVQERDAHLAKECGAAAFLLKTAGFKAILKAVRDVFDGKEISWNESFLPESS